jgi:hypothetical protein
MRLSKLAAARYRDDAASGAERGVSSCCARDPDRRPLIPRAKRTGALAAPIAKRLGESVGTTGSGGSNLRSILALNFALRLQVRPKLARPLARVYKAAAPL